jgi:uncharacterized membrane protein
MEKLFGVVLLVCVVVPTVTTAPGLVVKAAINAVTVGVLYGMFTDMVFAVLFIVPVNPASE